MSLRICPAGSGLVAGAPHGQLRTTYAAGWCLDFVTSEHEEPIEGIFLCSPFAFFEGAEMSEWIAVFKAARECRFCSVGKRASVCELPLSVFLVLVCCLPHVSVMSEVNIFVSSKRNFNILDHM